MTRRAMVRFGGPVLGLFLVLGPATAPSFAQTPAATRSGSTASDAPCASTSAAPDTLFSEVSPAPGTTIPSDRPFVYVRFSGDVDPRRTQFRFDGTTYTNATLRWSTGLMLLEQHVSAGCHTVDVSVTTRAGTTSDRRWTFTSGATAAKTVLAYYDAPHAGDAVPALAFVNGMAAPRARVVAVTGVGPAGGSPDGSVLDHVAVKETSADESGTFSVAPDARFDASHHGVLMLAAVDPVAQSLSFGGVYGLHTVTRWCPLGSQHLTAADRDADLGAFDTAQNALCDGDVARAEKAFASDAASMRKNRQHDGTRWLDYAQSYELTLLLTGKNDAAARFLRSIDGDRQATAADRSFFAGRYGDALAAYALERKNELAKLASIGGSDETKDSYEALMAGNDAARARRWSDAYVAWMNAASVRHTFVAWDEYDDWNLDALQMMYYFRAHIPK